KSVQGERPMESKKGWSGGNGSILSSSGGFWSFSPNNFPGRRNRHRRHRHVHLLDREAARKVGVDRKTRDPGQPVARKDQRPRITLFTRHSRVDKDVLQLAGAAAPEGAHPKPGTPVADTQLKSPLKVYRRGVVAAGAAPHLEARRLRGGAPRRRDFQV